jgi:hypothetical protein
MQMPIPSAYMDAHTTAYTDTHLLTTSAILTPQPRTNDSSAAQPQNWRSSYCNLPRDLRQNNQEHSRRNSRSRSPHRGGNENRKHSPDNSRNNQQHKQGFSQGAGTCSRSACAICLGCFTHDIQRCESLKLCDGTLAYCKKTQDNHLVNSQGSPLCFKWQRPSGCFTGNHELHHECSGCGSKEHSTQGCPRGKKE